MARRARCVKMIGVIMHISGTDSFNRLTIFFMRMAHLPRKIPLKKKKDKSCGIRRCLALRCGVDLWRASFAVVAFQLIGDVHMILCHAHILPSMSHAKEHRCKSCSHRISSRFQVFWGDVRTQSRHSAVDEHVRQQSPLKQRCLFFARSFQILHTPST